MDYPKFIVSNQKEESISIQRVNRHDQEIPQSQTNPCHGRDKTQKNRIFSENHNPTPLDMYNGLSQVYCIKPERRINSYTKGKRVSPRNVTITDQRPRDKTPESNKRSTHLTLEVSVHLGQWFVRKLCFNILIRLQYERTKLKGQPLKLIYSHCLIGLNISSANND